MAKRGKIDPHVLLFDSVRRGFVDEARAILAEGDIDLSHTDEDDGGVSYMHIAAKAGNVEMVGLLLEFGAGDHLGIVDQRGCTAVHDAVLASRNSGRIVEMLALAGADLDCGGAAARTGHLDELPPPCGGSALHFAVCTGNVEAAETLVRLGANPDVLNDKGIPPLNYAAHDVWVLLKGMTSERQKSDAQRELIRILVDAGADLNMKSGEGRTALEEPDGRLVRKAVEEREMRMRPSAHMREM